MNEVISAVPISQLLQRQVKAIRHKDIEAATFNYADDVVIFDIVGPLAQPAGIQSVKRRLAQWFDSFAETAGIGFEMVDQYIVMGEDMAVSHSLNHVHAPLKNGGELDMFWRETLTWQKRHGEWKIFHSHTSVPFDVQSGLASLGLKPDQDAQGHAN